MDFESAIDKIIDFVLKEFLGEGERVLREKAFGAALAVLNTVRKLVFLQYVIMAMCFLWALSFFAGGFLIAESWGRPFAWAPKFIFTVGVWTVTSAVLLYTVSEKAWARLLPAPPKRAPRAGLGAEEVAAIVEQVLERKLRAMESEPVTAVVPVPTTSDTPTGNSGQAAS